MKNNNNVMSPRWYNVKTRGCTTYKNQCNYIYKKKKKTTNRVYLNLKNTMVVEVWHYIEKKKGGGVNSVNVL